MDARPRIVAVAALLVAQAGCVTLPGPWQLGAGASHATLHTDYPALGDQSAPGVDLVASWGFTGQWWLDAFASVGHRIDTGTTQNIYYPPDHAEFGLFSLDVRREFWPVASRGWAPWLLGGVSVGSVMWDTYWYDVSGSGIVVGAGADARLGGTRAALRAQVLRHRLSAEDNYGYGPYRMTSTMASVMVVWTFGEDEGVAH